MNDCEMRCSARSYQARTSVFYNDEIHIRKDLADRKKAVNGDVGLRSGPTQDRHVTELTCTPIR